MLQALAAFGALAVIASAVVVILTSEPESTPRSAMLDVIQGGVQGRSPGSTAFQPAPDGVQLGAGDAIRTGLGARAEIVYFEGSITRLSASTTVEIEEVASAGDPPDALITLRQPIGRTYHRFEGEGPGGRFRVMTPTSIVTVRGSEFTVTVEAGGSTAYVALEDDLVIRTLAGSITVSGGEGLVVSSAGISGQPLPLTSEQGAAPWLCELLDPEAEGETCPSIELPPEVGPTPGIAPGITPGVTPSLPTPFPSFSPGAIPTPPGLKPSPTPTRTRPGSPRPTQEPSPTQVPPPGVPQTRITAGPARATNEATSSFSFRAEPRARSFQCQLDGGGWVGCSSPRFYGELPEGRHVFRVRALASGRADPTPAVRIWKIDRTRPESVINEGPPSETSSAQVTFRFSATERVVRFECKLDGGPFRRCRSPQSYQVNAPGSHTFQVRATDRAGNSDLTPAARTWQKT